MKSNLIHINDRMRSLMISSYVKQMYEIKYTCENLKMSNWPITYLKTGLITGDIQKDIQKI